MYTIRESKRRDLTLFWTSLNLCSAHPAMLSHCLAPALHISPIKHFHFHFFSCPCSSINTWDINGHGFRAIISLNPQITSLNPQKTFLITDRRDITILSDFTIFTKHITFYEILHVWQNFTILTKLHNFDKISPSILDPPRGKTGCPPRE